MEWLFSLQIIAGLLGLVIFYKLWIENTANKSKLQPPEPAGALPVIGHLHLMWGRKPLALVLGDMADKLGPAFMLRLGVNRVVVVSTWETAKECFTTNDKALASRPSFGVGKHLGYDYALWREMRKIVTHELMSNRQLELLKHIRASEIDTCMKELYGIWAKNGNRPVQMEMKKKFEELAFNTVVMMIAGKRYFGTNTTGEEGEARRFRNAMVELLHVFLLSDSLPFLKWLDLQHKSAMKKTAKEIDSVLTGWLDEHRRKRLSGEAESREDFIHVMLSTLEASHFPDYDLDTGIKAISLSLILGATDTTTATLTWALSLLLNHPEALKKAQDEVDTQVGKERNVEESDIKNLVYLQAIIKETMRLYPAGPLAVPHQSTESCYINGYYVPTGSWVVPNLWKLQRDPRKWSDPSEFRPERFLTSHANINYRGQHFEYIPFGSGRRSCPGISFATQVMHLALARLLHAYHAVTPSGEAMDMTEGFGLTMPKETPLDVLLTPRLPSKLYVE